MAVQRDVGGGILGQINGVQYNTLVPPSATVFLTFGPREQDYADYIFRYLLDSRTVPGAFSVVFTQYGAQPVRGTLFAGAREQYLDHFLRITNAYPVSYQITNLTNLVQRVIVYVQMMSVGTKEAYEELEHRLSRWYRQQGGIGKRS